MSDRYTPDDLRKHIPQYGEQIAHTPETIAIWDWLVEKYGLKDRDGLITYKDFDSYEEHRFFQGFIRDSSDKIRDEIIKATFGRYEDILNKQIADRQVIPVQMKMDIWDGVKSGDIYYTQPIQAIVFCRVGWARWIRSEDELNRLITEDVEKEAARTRMHPRSGACDKLRRAVLCR